MVSRSIQKSLIPPDTPIQSGSVPEPAKSYSRCLLDITIFVTFIGKHSASRATSAQFQTDAPLINNSVVFQYLAVS
jgi:hypothetical protein